MKSSCEGSRVSYEANVRDVAFEWRFELASVFALFRERCFDQDTIPKPGGLGSSAMHGGLAVRCLSGARVRFCFTLVRAQFTLWSADGTKVSRRPEQCKRETGALALGALRRTRGHVTRPGLHVQGYRRATRSKVPIRNIKERGQ